MSTTNREQWIVTNLTGQTIALSCNLAPALHASGSYDLLKFATKEEIEQSSFIKERLDGGTISIVKKVDGETIATVTTSAALVDQSEAGSGVHMTLTTYASNAAALLGGLAVGDLYKTSSGVVMVVI